MFLHITSRASPFPRRTPLNVCLHTWSAAQGTSNLVASGALGSGIPSETPNASASAAAATGSAGKGKSRTTQRHQEPTPQPGTVQDATVSSCFCRSSSPRVAPSLWRQRCMCVRVS
jgi:hypothetical protein